MSEEIKVPKYYVGDTYREGYYQARYVVEDFNCTYNVGNVVTYCLRSSFNLIYIREQLIVLTYRMFTKIYKSS